MHVLSFLETLSWRVNWHRQLWRLQVPDEGWAGLVPRGCGTRPVAPQHLHMAFPRRLSLCPKVPCKQGHGHAESQPSSRPHLHLVTSVRPHLQIRSHSELSEVRASVHEFGTGVRFNPSAGRMFK